MKQNNFAQPQINDIEPYRPGMSIEALVQTHGLSPESIIKLASNENPYGMSPLAHEAIVQASHDASRYPDGSMLRQALATRYGLSEANVILGNGSNDILDLIARVFLGNGTEAVSSQYAFSVYQLVTKLAGGRNVVVPAADYAHDLAAMSRAITASTRIVWIANPNNPTGTLVPPEELEDFIARLPDHVVTVLDEAYYEYLERALQIDGPSWLKKYPRLIIVRTFSKAYGLAGLRVGYALAALEITELLNRARQPFNVSYVAIAGAVAALSDSEFITSSYKHNREGLQQLKESIERFSLSSLPTNGNFITSKFGDADTVHEQLLQRGLIVRPLHEYGMPEYLRISVGTPAENTSLINALEEILG